MVGVEFPWPCQCYFRLRQSFFSFRALAKNSGLLEWRVDNFGAQTLGSFFQGFFINWSWFLAVIKLADQES